jgi:hypothetical protein
MAVDVDMKVIEGVAAEPLPNEEDLYVKLKTLQRQLEFLEIQVSLSPNRRIAQRQCNARTVMVSII